MRTHNVAGTALAAAVLAVLPLDVAVAAWLQTGAGAASAQAATLSAPATAAAAPTVGSTHSSITVTWSAAAGGPSPTGYRVYRVSPAGTVCTVAAASLSCPDTGLTSSTAYAYRVVTLRHSWESSAAPATATTSAPAQVPSVSIGAVPAQGVNYGTNASGSKVNWSGQDITGTVSEGAVVTVTMRNTTTGRYASAAVATSASPDRYTSTTPVALTTVVSGTTWTLDWDNDQFPPATASMEVSVSATNAAGSSQPVTRTFTFTR